jgi:hypothetical protein
VKVAQGNKKATLSDDLFASYVIIAVFDSLSHLKFLRPRAEKGLRQWVHI